MIFLKKSVLNVNMSHWDYMIDAEVWVGMCMIFCFLIAHIIRLFLINKTRALMIHKTDSFFVRKKRCFVLKLQVKTYV